MLVTLAAGSVAVENEGPTQIWNARLQPGEQLAIDVKVDVSNLFDELYFRARTGDTLGNVLAQALPDRRWQLTVKYVF